MPHDTESPYVAVTATTSAQQPTSARNLTHAPGVLHPRCPAAPMTTTQRRFRIRLGRDGWVYLAAVHSTCDGCPHHPRNEYGTWLADVLRFEWRAWAGYLYGPLTIAAQWGTRRAPRNTNGNPDLYYLVNHITEHTRHYWDIAQAAFSPQQRATYRLEQWHAQKGWQQRNHAVSDIAKGTTCMV